MNELLDWVSDNPWLPALIIYLVISVAPRPHPGKHEGVMKLLWKVLDAISLNVAGRFPGGLKLPFKVSPPEETTSSDADEAADKSEEDNSDGQK